MSANTALVVVDVQRVMFETPGEVLFEGERVLKTIAGLIASAREKNIPVVYIQHTTAGTGSEFEENSSGWQIVADIAPQDGDTVSLKTSYDAFFKTQFDEKLKRLGAQNLILCGMQTEFCVDTTLRSALAHGYINILVGDAHTTFDTEILPAKTIVAHHNRTWNGRFCNVVNAEAVVF